MNTTTSSLKPMSSLRVWTFEERIVVFNQVKRFSLLPLYKSVRLISPLCSAIMVSQATPFAGKLAAKFVENKDADLHPVNGDEDLHRTVSTRLQNPQAYIIVAAIKETRFIQGSCVIDL